MPLQLDDIALFVEVAKRKSISRSAEFLGVPASTLSRRLTQLEAELGMKLLNRSTRRIELTELGASYYARCQPLIDEARVAHEQLADMFAQPKGRLRISMPNSLATLVLPQLLREFTRAYPDIVVDIDLGTAPIDAMNNPFDVALRFGAQRDSSLISRQILAMDNWLFAAPEYLARHGTPREPADLRHHECLRPFVEEESMRWRLRRGDEVREIDVRGQIAVNNIGMLGTLARQGLGIAPILHCPGLRCMMVDESLVRVLPEWHLDPIPLYVLLPSRNVPAKTRAFRDFLSPLLAAP